MAKNSVKQNLTKKLEKLDKISEFFEQEEFDIDEGIKKFEEGLSLSQDIKEQLESYELKIKEIKAKYMEEDGDLG